MACGSLQLVEKGPGDVRRLDVPVTIDARRAVECEQPDVRVARRVGTARSGNGRDDALAAGASGRPISPEGGITAGSAGDLRLADVASATRGVVEDAVEWEIVGRERREDRLLHQRKRLAIAARVTVLQLGREAQV